LTWCVSAGLVGGADGVGGAGGFVTLHRGQFGGGGGGVGAARPAALPLGCSAQPLPRLNSSSGGSVVDASRPCRPASPVRPAAAGGG